MACSSVQIRSPHPRAGLRRKGKRKNKRKKPALLCNAHDDDNTPDNTPDHAPDQSRSIAAGEASKLVEAATEEIVAPVSKTVNTVHYEQRESEEEARWSYDILQSSDFIHDSSAVKRDSMSESWCMVS